MPRALDPFRFRADLDGRLDEQGQLQIIDYLLEENRVLREQPVGDGCGSTMTSAVD